ncbi:Transcriptional regulator [Rhodotorula sphaerocarpa]
MSHSSAPAGPSSRSGGPPSLDLRPFHIPPVPPTDSPLGICASGNGHVPATELPQLRASLLQARTAATARAQTCDTNRRLLAERLAYERSSATAAREAGKGKEAERKRKRDEEAAEEQPAAKGAAKTASKGVKANRESAAAASAASKGKQRAIDGRPTTAEADIADSTDADGDTAMGDTPTSGPSSAVATPASTATASKVPAPNRAQATPSADTDDDMKPPHLPRHPEKKKRRRDQVPESDASGSEEALRRVRAEDSTLGSASPAPPVPRTSTQQVASVAGATDAAATVEQKLKSERFSKHSIPIKPPAPGTASAFFVPANPLVPPKPPTNPPQATPKRQSEVTGDFSNAKPGQQIAHSTFQNWVDAYLRPFGEDDLAVLAAKPEDLTPYMIPPLGKHYLERWEEEDLDPSQRHSTSSSFTSPLEPPILPRLRPDALTEDALAGENVFLGPLSERLLAALAVGEDGLVAVDDEDDVGRPAEDGAALPAKYPMDAVDLEERIKRELRYIGILPEEEVDWASREDDEVSSALRACQRLLHQQTAVNEARKAVLTSLVKDRMAYQDYETARDAQERVIEQGWQKRLRTDVKKKKKGKDRDRRGGGSAAAAAAAEAAKDEDPSKAPVSAELLDAVARRDRLVSTFKPFFGEEEVGHYFGLPERSIFEGLEAEVLGEDGSEPGVDGPAGEAGLEATGSGAAATNGGGATPALVLEERPSM